MICTIIKKNARRARLTTLENVSVFERSVIAAFRSIDVNGSFLAQNPLNITKHTLFEESDTIKTIFGIPKYMKLKQRVLRHGKYTRGSPNTCKIENNHFRFKSILIMLFSVFDCPGSEAQHQHSFGDPTYFHGFKMDGIPNKLVPMLILNFLLIEYVFTRFGR